MNMERRLSIQPRPTEPGSIPPNARHHYDVSRLDLPLHCPMPGMSLWNSHPKVYLPIEETGKARCPYCSANYTLVD
jgi:uncharacterized Zn-finger protein